jgi:hypothetical protein
MPENLNEKLAVLKVASDPKAGYTIKDVIMSDSKNGWLAKDGWVKKQLTTSTVTIHYVYNNVTNEVDDIKIYNVLFKK